MRKLDTNNLHARGCLLKSVVISEYNILVPLNWISQVKVHSEFNFLGNSLPDFCCPGVCCLLSLLLAQVSIQGTIADSHHEFHGQHAIYKASPS